MNKAKLAAKVAMVLEGATLSERLEVLGVVLVTQLEDEGNSNGAFLKVNGWTVRVEGGEPCDCPVCVATRERKLGGMIEESEKPRATSKLEDDKWLPRPPKNSLRAAIQKMIDPELHKALFPEPSTAVDLTLMPTDEANKALKSMRDNETPRAKGGKFDA